MIEDKSSSNREKKKYKVPNATELIGKALKKRRTKLELSLSDVADMTGFSGSTIVDTENGITADINYYISYAQTLNYKLSELFDIDIPYGARYPLSAKKEARLFITNNIKKLYTEYDFFAEKQSVANVAAKLQELKIIKGITPSISTRISGILLSLVDEKMLHIVEKNGRNNIYLKTIKQ